MGALVKALAAPFIVYNAVSDEVAKQRRLRLTDGAGWREFFGMQSAAGKNVTLTSTLSLSAAWACIRTSASAVASLPPHMYEKRQGGSREMVEDGRIAEVICDSPNRDQTPLEFWETMTAWLLCHGNSYAEQVRIGRDGRLAALQPIPASKCRPVRGEDGDLVYRVNDRGKPEDLPRDKIFHVRGFGQGLMHPDMGLSPIAAGVQSLGAAMAAQEAAGSVFANGMRPAGFFMFDQQLTDEQREQAKKNLIEPLRGSARTGGAGILESGVKFEPLTLNPEDAQMLETRRFDVEEVCRWFGVPPLVIGHSSDGQTMWGTGVEQILLSWLTLGIDPICDRIEARINKDLVRRDEGRRRYVEFDREALLAMDSAAKSQFLSQMVQNGLMTRNEGRQKLNLPRRPEAEALTAQTNLSPLEALGREPEGNQLRAAMRAFLGIGDQSKEDRDHDHS